MAIVEKTADLDEGGRRSASWVACGAGGGKLFGQLGVVLASARNESLRPAFDYMSLFILLAVVFAAGFLALAVLIVLETELCPQSARKMLKKRAALPMTLEEEEAKRSLQAAHTLRLKKLQLAGRH